MLAKLKAIGPEFATTLVGEVFYREFANRRKLGSYVGLGSSPFCSGPVDRDQGISKAGNRRARRMLVECSWSYQHPPRVGQAKQAKVDAASPLVREIAWKAQCRLYRRYRTLIRNGKLRTVAIVAIARELAGFIWAVARAVTTAPVVATPA